MSDIFNHLEDAFNNLFDSYEHGTGKREDSGTAPNPLFYHIKIQYIDLLGETEKAYCFKLIVARKKIELWIPKSICRKMDTKNKTVYVHTRTYFNILKTKAEKMIGTSSDNTKTEKYR